MDTESLKSSFIEKCLQHYSSGSTAWKDDMFFIITANKIEQLPQDELVDLYSVFHWDQVLPQE
jgi:hypothetical protein